MRLPQATDLPSVIADLLQVAVQLFTRHFLCQKSGELPRKQTYAVPKPALMPALFARAKRPERRPIRRL